MEKIRAVIIRTETHFLSSSIDLWFLFHVIVTNTIATNEDASFKEMELRAKYDDWGYRQLSKRRFDWCMSNKFYVALMKMAKE